MILDGDWYTDSQSSPAFSFQHSFLVLYHDDETFPEQGGCREWYNNQSRVGRGRAALVGGKKTQLSKSDYPRHRVSWPDSTT